MQPLISISEGNRFTDCFQVQYAPRVSAGPVSEYNAEEGESIELICEADGNPQPTAFEWLHTASGQRSSDARRRFTVKRADAGEHRCAVTNAIGTAFDTVAVNVLYAPIVKVVVSSTCCRHAFACIELHSSL